MEYKFEFNLPDEETMKSNRISLHNYTIKLKKRKLLFKKRSKRERRKHLLYLLKSLKHPNSIYSKIGMQLLKKHNQIN